MSRRNELSTKNKYYIPPERYLELKHRVRQYREWKRKIIELQNKGVSSRANNAPRIKSSKFSDTTAMLALDIYNYAAKVKQVDEALEEVGDGLESYILLCVVDGQSFEKIKASLNIPCGKDYFYERYHKFFWILDKKVN